MHLLSNFQCAIEGCNYPVYSGSFCNHHTESAQKLKIAFEQWQQAYDGKIEWQEYLQILVGKKVAGVGRYIEELANYYLQEQVKNTR